RAVLDPLSGLAHDSLAGVNNEHSASVRDPQPSLQDDGELCKFRSLPRLDPACRTVHMGDAQLSVVGIDPTDVFVDQLWLIARRPDPGRLMNQLRHACIS